MKNILDIAASLGIDKQYILPYGWDKAKIDLKINERLKDTSDGKLVLVTAITPTKAGEGKTTTTIGLHDGLRRIGLKSLAVLREPSLGPVFGIKGGAVGALKSTIVPSDDINLHLNGDFHALTSTINLIAAIIENSIYQGNELNIDPNKIVWTRALDMNDRSLRDITINYHDKKYSGSHHSEFIITVASELMATFCIADSEEDFLNRTENIIVAYTFEDKPVYVRDLNIRGAIKKLMHTALNPNLVQTLEENPVLVHGGPFANIAHGCNSLIATELGLKLADIVVTEAGFGGDLGAEKFLDIKCQRAGLKPSCIVLVATIRALKFHGGVAFEDLDKENIPAIVAGLPNLEKHYNNLVGYGIPVVVAINVFPSDTETEIRALGSIFDDDDHKYNWALNTAALEGSRGAVRLAEQVRDICTVSDAVRKQAGWEFKPLYDWSEPIKQKIEKICKQIYGAANVEYSELAEQQISKYTEMGYDKLAICVAKTPNSLTEDPKILGAPTGFTIHIREIRLSAGAGFLVPLTGAIMTMPGLPKEPLACKM